MQFSEVKILVLLLFMALSACRSSGDESRQEKSILEQKYQEVPAPNLRPTESPSANTPYKKENNRAKKDTISSVRKQRIRAAGNLQCPDPMKPCKLDIFKFIDDVRGNQ
jgi:hypothetical protein